MRHCSFACVLFFAGLGVNAAQETFAQQAQQKPLTRTFVSGSEERYEFTATVRVETHGISTEKIGEKTYATPYTHEAGGEISWRATRKISAVTADGVASVSETLDQFNVNCGAPAATSNATPELQESVRDACASWQNLPRMNYEEEKFGLIRGLLIPGGTQDADSPLLDYWLRRALRPSTILPKTLLNFGTVTSHKIANPSGAASNPAGEESTEWLEASTEAPAATLHVTQNLSWIDSPRKIGFSSVDGRPPIRQLFYADSLNTISLLDGSVIKASRSATRETKEVLDPVPGLPDAPTFSSKLTITVSIHRLP